MATRKEILPRYEDDLFGIPVTVLNSVIQETHDDGSVFVTIPNERALAAAIAIARALLPIKLRPNDIRMMRKTLGMKAKDFAEALDIDPSRLSRLEKDTQGLGSFTELNIRQFVCARLTDLAPAIDYDPAKIATMRIKELAGGKKFPELVFERVRLKRAESRKKSDEWDLAA